MPRGQYVRTPEMIAAIVREIRSAPRGMRATDVQRIAA